MLHVTPKVPYQKTPIVLFNAVYVVSKPSDSSSLPVLKICVDLSNNRIVTAEHTFRNTSRSAVSESLSNGAGLPCTSSDISACRAASSLSAGPILTRSADVDLAEMPKRRRLSATYIEKWSSQILDIVSQIDDSIASRCRSGSGCR